MKQRENAGVAFGCEYRDGAITPVYQCFVGFSMGNTVSIRSIMYSSIIARLEVQLCFFFFYIFQIWELKAELTECDCRVRGETERTRGCSGPALLRGSWAVCLHSHICMHSIQLVRKDHPRLCRHPS